MTTGPYGNGVKYQEHYKLMWDWLVEQHPDILAGSTLPGLGNSRPGNMGAMGLCCHPR
jgi:hypothetical protein